MNATRLLTATTALILVAGAAYAQAPAPAAAPAAPAAAAPGQPALTPPAAPPIPGVCVFSIDRTIAVSNVGKAFQTRMQQLTQQADAELGPERNQLQTDVQTLQGQQASLAQDAYQQRAVALNQRIQGFQQKADQRTQELEATRDKNLNRIIQEVQPLLVSVYNTRKCSVVMNAEALIAANPGMDISDDVATQLNGRMSTITFDRERLDGPGAAAPRAAAPAGAAPAAARPAGAAPAAGGARRAR